MAIEVPDEIRPRGPGLTAPARRPGSVRRTLTLDFTWPEGMDGDVVVDGRARDLLTSAEAVVDTAETATLEVRTDRRRVITAVRSRPELEGLDGLVGAASMSGFRRRLGEVVGARVEELGACYQLLDDIPGATLVSGAAYRPFFTRERYLELRKAVSTRVVTDICTGYQQGSSALKPDGTMRWSSGFVRGPSIDATSDPLGWHQLPQPELGSASSRRARRIDVWLQDGAVRIDAFFQDSVVEPGGERQIIHEYALGATADPAAERLLAVEATAGVLPYAECPLATQNVATLVGRSLGELRTTVLATLDGPAGCTHLNDMLRALADIPHLVARLKRS